VDVNNDGKLDLLSGGRDAGDHLQIGNGDGTFKTATVLPDHYLGKSGQTIFFTYIDANNDGYKDILSITTDGRGATFYQTSNVHLYINNGAGGFTDGSSRLPAGGSLTSWPQLLYVTDLDNDGFDDVLLDQSGCPILDTTHCFGGTVWLNNGSGFFSNTTVNVTDSSGNLFSQSWIDIPNNSSTPSGLRNLAFKVGDINNDGKPDAMNISGQYTYVNMSTPGSLQFKAVFWGVYEAPFSPQQGALVDYNNDGLLDFIGSVGIAGSSSSTVPVRVWKNMGDGTFIEDMAALSSAIGVQHGRQWLVADFDGDGKDDIYVADHGWDNPPFPGFPNTLIKNNGNGTLTDASTSLSRKKSYTHGASVGDVNADGKIDLFENNTWEGLTAEQDAYLFLNQGSLKFVAAP
jgi:hypothetical protein